MGFYAIKNTCLAILKSTLFYLYIVLSKKKGEKSDLIIRKNENMLSIIFFGKSSY